MHTGAHKINNALGQALLARRMGKRRIIAETGAGQHGVATATAARSSASSASSTWARGHAAPVAQRLAHAAARRDGRARRGRARATLKDAMNEAIRDWVTNVATPTTSSARSSGRHPYPALVRDFQR